MLNNKKGLLQRARIAMVAIVTIIGISGAFAMSPHRSADSQTWGVLQTNASSYVVTAITANSFCDGAAKICKVRSSVSPNPETHELSTMDAQPVTDEPGNFTK